MTDTRQDVVEAHIEELVGDYGEDAFRRLVVEILKDISITLAMLADK